MEPLSYYETDAVILVRLIVNTTGMVCLKDKISTVYNFGELTFNKPFVIIGNFPVRSIAIIGFLELAVVTFL